MTPAYQIHFAKGLLRIGACEKLYDLLEGIIRDSSNLFIRSILDWMWHKQHRRVVTQGCRLCFRSFYKFGSSDANPKDTKDYEEGVWTLPPTLTLGDKDKDKYVAIGESDRMTLRFKKK